MFVTLLQAGHNELGEETIKKILRNLKLTEKEAEVYIFLSKHGVLKCLEIARGMKRHKAQIYRILKILQTKGLLESTLEAPARFSAVPFETVLDLSIKAKRDEAVQMENTKTEILSSWKTIRQPRIDTSLEKFVVIEGASKIYSKISQMIRDTELQLSAVTTVTGMLRADRFGLFDAVFTHPLKSRIEFRFLTDLSEKNLESMKSLLNRRLKANFSVKGRSPDLGSSLPPRMVIRDAEEALFFITPRSSADATGREEVGLLTDCKELVSAFTGIFEEMWRNATDIQTEIAAVESPGQPKLHVIEDEDEAKQKYRELLNSACEEILVMTAPRSLKDLCADLEPLNEAVRRGALVKIMAPIIDENQDAARQLAGLGQVRHIARSDSASTIIDGRYLFQFQDIQIDQEISKPLHFGNAYFSDDFEYVSKMKMTMEDLWKKAPVPSYVTWELSFGPLARHGAFSDSGLGAKKTSGQAIVEISGDEGGDYQTPVPSMEYVRERLRHYDQTKEPLIAYGWMARAIIRLPNFPKIPLIGINVIHFHEKSAFGGGSYLEVYSWQEAPPGNAFVPVALVVNRQGAIAMQPIYAGTPASQNMVLIEPHRQLEVFRKGTTVFAGWTVDIPLPPSEYSLGPSCIFFEGHGPVKQETKSSSFPSGYKNTMDYKISHAFVTFMNQSHPYVGTGIQGHLVTEYVMRTTKP